MVLGAVALLGVAVLAGPVADARHPVVTVDGVTVGRTELRARMALDTVLAEARRVHLRTLLTAGRMSAEDAARIGAAINSATADPLRAAVDGLVADAILRREAEALGLDTKGDPATEARRTASADIAIRVEAITVADPFTLAASPGAAPPSLPGPAGPGSEPATVGAARLAAVTAGAADVAAGADRAAVVARLTAAGWRASTWDGWITTTGPVDGLPDTLLAAARDPGSLAGTPLAATDDAVHAVAAAGSVLDTADAASAPSVTLEGIDGGALERWASARAAERALRARLADGWAAGPLPSIRVMLCWRACPACSASIVTIWLKACALRFAGLAHGAISACAAFAYWSMGCP